MLFLISYIFLLRLPSEALPIAVEAGACAISAQDVNIVLSLRRHKNQPGGSKLIRGCWCRASKDTCPVHVVGRFCRSAGAGTQLFRGISASAALKVLR